MAAAHVPRTAAAGLHASAQSPPRAAASTSAAAAPGASAARPTEVARAGADAAALAATHGVHEMVVGVADLAAATRIWREVVGFEEVWAGPLAGELAALWQLPAATRGRQRLLGNPRAPFGLVRLVEFEGVQQVQVRSSARPFDTGGIFNVNLLVRDIDASFEALRAVGFQGFADPSRYELFGRPYAGAMLRGHDGVVLNLLARLDRGYEDQPPFVRMSHVLNATQIVADFDAAVAFYEQSLGWHKRWEASPRWQADGRNNMGLPESLVLSGTVRERAASFAPCADCRGGTVEVFGFEGVRGRDYAERAQPPNLGILMYVVSVPELDGYLREIGARGVVPLAPPRELALPPYGRVRAAVVRAPGGAWHLFVQALEAGPAAPSASGGSNDE